MFLLKAINKSNYGYYLTQKWPKRGQDSRKGPFLPEGPKKHESKTKALEVGPLSGLYLLKGAKTAQKALVLLKCRKSLCQSLPQVLEVGPCSGLYLLVKLIILNCAIDFQTMIKGTQGFVCCLFKRGANHV